MEIIAESEYRFVIPRHGRMRVPGVVFASRALIPDPAADRALEQVINVAELPGIVEASYAMPDVHWGYGFPIGGVAATDIDRGGVVTPGRPRGDGVGGCGWPGHRSPAAPVAAGAGQGESRRREDPVTRDRLVRLSGGTRSVNPDPARGHGGSIRRSGMTYDAPPGCPGRRPPFEDHLDAERSMNTCWAPRWASPAAGCRRTYSPSGCMSQAEQLSCS